MQLGFNRRNIGRLILLGWAVALAWLARRQFAASDAAETAVRTRKLAPSASYYAVFAGARQIGQLNMTVDTTLDGVTLNELLVIDLPRADTTQQLARNLDYTLSRSLQMRTLKHIVFGSGQREQLDGRLGSDSILNLQNVEGAEGELARMRLRIPPDAMLATMLPYRAAFGDQLQVGGRFVAPLLDLSSGETRPIIVNVTAESTFIVPDSAAWDSVASEWAPATSDTIQAWRLEHDAPGAPTVSWVDGTGSIIRQETAGGLTLVRSAFEIVRNNYRRIRVTGQSDWRREIPGMIALISSRGRPDTLERERAFVVRPDSTGRVPGVPRDLVGGRQSLRGDTLVVSRTVRPDTSERSAREARLTLGPSWEAPLQDPAMAPAATEALRGARSLGDSIRRLTLWVATRIATDSGNAAPATAGPALRARRASADGKARLLATLARVSGIPARVVTGVAVLPQGTSGHAWTELWMGGWSAADPTYGQFPASASLIRLRVGGRSHVIDLLPVTGSARFLPIRRPL